MAQIVLDGFDELEELLQEMIIDETDMTKAMKKAINIIGDEVLRNTPARSGKLKKSLKRTVKKEDLAVVGVVKFGVFWDVFQEYGTSQQKNNVGFFERSVNKAEKEAIKVIADELLK